MKIDYFSDTFTYFRTLCTDIADNKSLLDFGCNYGSFLESSERRFDEKLYTGIDVDIDALSIGREMFPNATFIHSNQHNYMYNNNGSTIMPEVGKFDNIVSYSVFTHTTLNDFMSNLEWLYTKLNVGGKLMCTYLNIEHAPTVNYFYNKRVNDFGHCDRITTETFIYLLDNKVSTTEMNCNFFLSFFQNSYLESLLRERKYSFKLYDNINAKNCFQSCIVIEK